MSTMAPATQPTLEDVLTHMSAQIAALTREVKELRALKEDVDELRAFNDARLVQLEESNEDLVSMSATPKVVIVQPSAPLEATQPPAD
jgi:prefoldin subunit 5